MLAMQMGAPNSPQWFNTGLHWAYGIDGPGQGHFYVDFTGELKLSQSAYEHPQPHACFIQSVKDDLVNENGIMDLWVREARLFKYGSGTGTNFSSLRGEREALGRRQVLGADELPQDRRPRRGRHQVGRHDAARGQDGGRRPRSPGHRGLHRLEGEGGAEGRRPRHRLQDLPAAPQGDHEGLRQLRGRGRRLLRSGQEPGAEARHQDARAATSCPTTTSCASSSSRARASTEIEFATYDTDWDSEAYLTVSGQNSNNSVRVTDEFLQAVADDRPWDLTSRTTGKAVKTIRGARPVGRDRPRRVGLRRPRHPVRHDDQRLAHLPGVGADQRVQPVLGVHVPRRHGVQPGVAQPDDVPSPRRRAGRSTSTPTGTPAGCGH